MDLELICKICFEGYNLDDRVPRVIIKCGHTVCTSCLSEMIDNQDELKCPFDNEFIYEEDIESFPVNFALKELVENQAKVKLCQIHHKELSFVCLTEKTKICFNCYDVHQEMNHKILTLTKIENKAAETNQKVNKLIEDTKSYYKNLSFEFQKNCQKHIKKIKDKYQEMKDAIEAKETEEIFKTQYIFDTHQNLLDETLGEKSNFVESFSQLKSNLDNVSSHHEYFDLNIFDQLETKVNEYQSGLKLNLSVEHFNAEFDQLANSLHNNFKDQKLFLPDVPKPNFNSTKIITSPFVNDNSISLPLNLDPDLNSLTKKSHLKFETLGSCLNIKSGNNESHNIFVDLSEWKKSDTIKLTLDKKLSEEDLLLLSYVWDKLDKYRELKLKFMTDAFSKRLFRILLRVSETVQILDINVIGCEIKKEILVFIEQMLLRNNNLKKLFINFAKTKILGNSFENIFTFYPKNIETLNLNLRDTNITDEDLKCFLVEMHHLKTLSLYLSQTNITDKALELCYSRTLSKARDLESLTLFLNNTKLNDYGIESLLGSLKGIKKKFHIRLKNTQITDKTVLLISQKLDDFGMIEHFDLSLSSTKITDEGIRFLFKPLPSIIFLELAFENLNISDQTLMKFAEITLASMKRLDTLKLWLCRTKITDKGVIKLMENIGDLKELLLNFTNTRISDYSLKQFITEKIPKMLASFKK